MNLTFNQQPYPTEWAATQSDIAHNLVDMGKLEPGTQRLREAVGTYQQVLLVWNRDQFPDEWAKTQIEFGEALAELGERDPNGGNLAQAINAEKSALEVLSREIDPVPGRARNPISGSNSRTSRCERLR